jgi:DNA-binding transcriptional regulator YhcF (GntR family)
MDINVDLTSRQPPYEQVRDQIRTQVDQGSVTAGSRLPTVRVLADNLGLATNTVARAYRELEQLGVIETRGRAGSFVRSADSRRMAGEAAHEYAQRVRALGVGRDEALALVRRAYG